MKEYHLYLKEGDDWREFGKDYALDDARQAKADYAMSFPTDTYIIRKSGSATYVFHHDPEILQMHGIDFGVDRCLICDGPAEEHHGPDCDCGYHNIARPHYDAEGPIMGDRGRSW